MDTIFFSFLAVIIIIYGFRMFLTYKDYDKTIFQALYHSYFEFFFRTNIRKDASSCLNLKKKLGTHRMIFTTIQNEQRQVTSRFVILFYNKGVALISYLNPKGSLYAESDAKDWYVKRDSRKFKIKNPKLESDKYAQRLQQFLPNVTITQYVAVNDDTDLTNVHTKYVTCHFDQLVDELKNASASYIDESEVIPLFDSVNNARSN